MTYRKGLRWNEDCPVCHQEIQNVWDKRPPGGVYLNCPHCEAGLQIREEHTTEYHLEIRGGGPTVAP